MCVPLVLAGGRGAATWPLSRDHHPRHLIPGRDGQTSLAALLAVFGAAGLPSGVVIAPEDQRFLCAEAIRGVGRSDRLLIEPDARGTAPATEAALAWLDGDPIVLHAAADVRIGDPVAFAAAVARAVGLASTGALAVLVTDAAPPGPRFGAVVDGRFMAVGAGEGRVATGIVVGRASRLATVGRAARAAAATAITDLDFVRLGGAAAEIPGGSVERAWDGQEVVAVGLAGPWADVGTLDAWLDGGSRGDVVVVDSPGTVAWAGHRLVAVVGLSDVSVVETADAVLVAPRGADPSAVVAALRATGRAEVAWHRRVARPWGAYELVDVGRGFWVKRLEVRPGASLSLQRHQRRAEHWVVVEGQAQVTCGDRTFVLGPDESTFLPRGVAHRLENPGPGLLRIVEVATGDHLGEDDIERLADRYGR